MAFNVLGYVLEPPRVGQSNSPFTLTPNDVKSAPSTFATFFPQGSQPNPRVDYMALVVTDGLLPDATFAWTKNELVARFDYSGPDQRFKNLPGGPIAIVGQVGPTINTPGTRLNVPVPQVISGPVAPAPFRVSVGIVGAGTTFASTLVSAFTTPSAGNVQILLADDLSGNHAGDINWNSADLVTFSGETVRFQQQAFFTFKQSTGNIGLSTGTLILTPLPDAAQFPLLRLGYGAWLTPNAVSSFSSPPSTGTFNWQIGTGLVQLSTADAATGKPVYYDGVMMAFSVQLPRTSLGTVTSPGTITPVPIQGGDLIFRLTTVPGEPEFPTFEYVTSFGFGQAGTVQLLTGSSPLQVQFSGSDQSKYGVAPVTLISGDLPIERGISLRLFRTPVNLAGEPVSQGGTKDVTSLYTVTNATYANPIIGAPFLFLPSVPRDDGTLVVSVAQGTGTFTPGVLPLLDGSVPLPSGNGPTYGYVINYDTRQLLWAFRRNNVLVKLIQPAGAVMLPDPLVQAGALTFALETGPGTGNYHSLTLGTDILFDGTAGQVTFIDTIGLEEASGDAGSFTGTTLTDTNAPFGTVAPGDFLVVDTGNAWDDPSPGDAGVYTVETVPNASTLTTDLAAPVSSPVGYQVLRGKEVLADRYFAPVELVDPNTKVERIDAAGVIANASTIVSGTSSSNDATTFTSSTDFVAAGVHPGDTIELTSGPDTGSFRRIQQVQQFTVTVIASYPFVDFTVGVTFTVVRRLNVPVADVSRERFRFGQALFASATVVASDGAFTTPTQGTVQISAKTGNLNFNSLDVATGVEVYSVKLLTNLTDYVINPQLGSITFATRMLTNEEVLITYVGTDPTTGNLVPLVERGTFLVRKELTQPHPLPTATLTFNPLGKTVASIPFPSVWRGGRPQNIPGQCSVNPATSTITFLQDSQKQTALPHGVPIAPNENVYIDYYIYQAMGGEQTLTVLQPPMSTAQVILTEGSPNFVVMGNQTGALAAGFLLNVANAEIHIISASSYDSSANTTTVTLGLGDVFLNSYQNPQLFVTSGPTRLTSSLLFPSYFSIELSPYTTVARGSNKVVLSGNRLSSYKTNTVILFTDSSTFQNFYAVSQASLDSNGNTVLTLNSNTLQQYTFGPSGPVLRYSVRPILSAGATQVQTNLTPVTSQSITVFRRVEGQIGALMSTPGDYTIDPSGTVTFAPPLNLNEEISIFYTGHVVEPAGINLRASYTALAVPNTTNGLINQILQANYHLFSPDTFYFRVEILSPNFVGEVAQTIQQQAQQSIPTSGPVTSNSGGGPLYKQGRPSLYFDEGHDANEDYVAQLTLKFYNDIVNDLEDALQAMDGRVVGDSDGRFLFDGVTGRVVTPGFPLALSSIHNQIDDLVQVSPFPLPTGVYQPIYQTGPYSRFFKNRRTIFTTSPCQDPNSPPNAGDPVAKFDFVNLSSLPSTVARRAPRAQIQFSYPPGTTSFKVDNATGTTDALQRPEFPTSGANSPMKVVVEDLTHNETLGNSYIPASANVTVVSVTAGPPDTVVLSGSSSSTIPAGATITVSPTDANTMLSNGSDPPGSGGYQMIYQFGKDVDCNLGTGELLYKKRTFPFDGTLPTSIIPKFLLVYPVQLGTTTGDILQVNGAGVAVTNIAPYRFPALDGLTVNDDGDQAVPMVGPLFTGELTPTQGGALYSEQAILTSWAATTPPFIGTGSLTTLSTIQLAVGTFPSPVPAQYDLVRILTGTQGPSTWRHVASATTNTITVVEAFAGLDSGFTFQVAVKTVAATGTSGTTTFTGTSLVDTAATFTSALVGLTVAIETAVGSNAYVRRQVVSVSSATTLVLDVAVPLNGAFTYEIVNPLNTYNGSLLTLIQADVTAELASVSSEATAIDNFFNEIFSAPIVSSTTGHVTTSGSNLSDTSVNFVTSDVTTSDYVWVQTGANLGVYQIASIGGPTALTIQQTFPSGTTSLPYSIVSAFGCTFPTMQALYGILTTNTTFQTSTTAWQTAITATTVVVAGDASAYANSLKIQASDISSRQTVVAARISYLTNAGTGPIATIENALSGTEKLYDKRYSWINGRLNVQNGFLAAEALAIANRLTAQANLETQLLQLLAVQGGG